MTPAEAAAAAPSLESVLPMTKNTALRFILSVPFDSTSTMDAQPPRCPNTCCATGEPDRTPAIGHHKPVPLTAVSTLLF